MTQLLRKTRVPRRERGATATEYAILVAGIALVLVAATYAFGDDLGVALQQLGDFIDGL